MDMPYHDPDKVDAVVAKVTKRGWATIPQAALMLNMHHQTVAAHVAYDPPKIMSAVIGKRKVIFLSEINRVRKERLSRKAPQLDELTP